MLFETTVRVGSCLFNVITLRFEDDVYDTSVQVVSGSPTPDQIIIALQQGAEENIAVANGAVIDDVA